MRVVWDEDKCLEPGYGSNCESHFTKTLSYSCALFQIKFVPRHAIQTRQEWLRKAWGGRAEKIVPVNYNYVTDLRWRHTTSILTVAGPAPIGIQSTRNVINDITAIVSDGGWQIELTRRNGEHYQTHNFRRKRNKLCPRQKLHFPHICPGFYLSSTTESAPASVNLRTRKLIPLQKKKTGSWLSSFPTWFLK
jgi:hypothetical protein